MAGRRRLWSGLERSDTLCEGCGRLSGLGDLGFQRLRTLGQASQLLPLRRGLDLGDPVELVVLPAERVALDHADAGHFGHEVGKSDPTASGGLSCVASRSWWLVRRRVSKRSGGDVGRAMLPSRLVLVRLLGVDAVPGRGPHVCRRGRRVGAEVGAELVVVVTWHRLGGLRSPFSSVVAGLHVIIIHVIHCALSLVVALVVVRLVTVAPPTPTVSPQPFVGFGPRVGSQRSMRRRVDAKLSSEKLSKVLCSGRLHGQ